MPDTVLRAPPARTARPPVTTLAHPPSIRGERGTTRRKEKEEREEVSQVPLVFERRQQLIVVQVLQVEQGGRADGGSK